MAREHFLRGFTDIREHVCVGTRPSTSVYLVEWTRCGGYGHWDGAFQDRLECPIPTTTDQVLNRLEMLTVILIQTDVCHQTLPLDFLVAGVDVLEQ